MTVRVVIADDSLLIRDGLRMVIEHIDDVEIIGEATDLPTLLDAVAEHEPDVVITDLRMPPTGTNEGLEAARTIRATHPDVGVILLTQHADPEHVLGMLADGTAAVGYLLKENLGDRTELGRAIRSVAEGGSAIDPAVVDILVRANTASSSPLEQLSPREREVMGLVAEGLANAGIAERLVISTKAVEKHVGAIFTKLGLSEETDAHRRVRAVLMWLGER